VQSRTQTVPFRRVDVAKFTPTLFVEIVGSVAFDRPLRPSALFYEGRKEQLAFEKPDGRSADKRHQVGEIDVASHVVDGAKRAEPPEILPPPLIALKDRIWHGVGNTVTE
jgi:hypothetical protein